MTPRISRRRGGFRWPCLFFFLLLGGILAVLGSQPAAGQPGNGLGRRDGSTIRCRPRPITPRLPTSTTATTVRPWNTSRPTPSARSRPRSRAGSTRSATRRCRASATTRWASIPRPWPITRPPWKSIRPFPLGCPRLSSRRSVPIPAARSRPLAGPPAASPVGPIAVQHVIGAGPGRYLVAALQQGGVVQRPTCFPSSRREIVRCTALAIRRRGELLGPLAAHDPVIDNIIAALQRRPGQPNHWSEAWINLELGLALSAGGRTAAAIPLLQKATLASGEFEHPLTAIAHLELGRLAMAAGDYARGRCPFRRGLLRLVLLHRREPLARPGRDGRGLSLRGVESPLGQRQSHFPVAGCLGTAAAWAKANHCRQLYVSLLTLAAENNLVLGQTQRPWRCWMTPARPSATRPWPAAGLPHGECSWRPPRFTRPARSPTEMRISPR